mmetsp:Transcript_550/g.1401  ORF Transcript_550/g.1401 Transcript_550/m.1401 type:complete len:718 (+) Transcript_550:324-2477(+)
MLHITDGVVELAPDFKLAYQVWLPEGVASLNDLAPERRILSWPGWLDNSGSFEPIAPLFAQRGFGVVAIDPPGCGRSTHRAQCAWYHDFEEAHMIMRVADVLGWTEPFVIMSHSRGSNVTMFTAGSFPHRVRALVLFESSLGMAGTYILNRKEAGPVWGGFSTAIDMDHKNRARVPRRFKELEEAIQHNYTNPAFPKSRQVSESIVKRHIVDHPEGGITFSHDVRTYGQTQSRYIDEEVNTPFLRATRAPVLNFYGADSSLAQFAIYDTDEEATKAYREIYNWIEVPESVFAPYVRDVRARMRELVEFKAAIIPGAHHHLHGDVPEEVAAIALPWLEERISKPIETSLPEDLRGKAGDLWLKSSVEHLLAPIVGKEMPMSELPEDLRASQTHAIFGEDIEVEVDGLELGAQRWGNPDSENRVLAWPDSWDSSASFQLLAQQAVAAAPDGDLCVVAVDPPGVGLSQGVPYDWGFGTSETAALLLRVSEALGWEENFSLWGHGAGASVALYAAGGAPSKINAVILFDPQTLTIPAEWAPAEVYYSYEERCAEPHTLPHFKTREELVSRLQTDPNFPKSITTAEAIASRLAVRSEKDNSWTLNLDSRVFRVRKPILETPAETYHDLLADIQAPVLAIFPTDSARAYAGPASQRRRILTELGAIRSPLTTVRVKGGSLAHSCNAESMLPVVRDWDHQLESLRRLNLASTSRETKQDAVSKL